MKPGEEKTLSMNEMFSMICPEGKSEYVSKLVDIITGYPSFETQVKQLKEILTKEYGIDPERLVNLTSLQVVQVYNVFTSFDIDDVVAYQKVCKGHLNGEVPDEEFSDLQNFDNVRNYSKNLKNGQPTEV
jgi:hypothetical protein